MCLAVPVKVVSVSDDGQTAEVDSKGMVSRVNLQLIEDCRPGSYVLTHAGYAIALIDAVEAKERLKLWKELAEFESSD